MIKFLKRFLHFIHEYEINDINEYINHAKCKKCKKDLFLVDEEMKKITQKNIDKY